MKQSISASTASATRTLIPAFTDIQNHWAADNILFVVSRGLLSGISDTTFSPGTGMTRGMFVTALGRLAGIDPDRLPDREIHRCESRRLLCALCQLGGAELALCRALRQPPTFAPDTNINREQMAVIMKNYAAKAGL